MESHNLSVHSISRFLLSLSDDRIEDWMTPLKIQKLLYYAQAVSLVTTWKSLFTNEIQAWMHWPVIPEIYHTYKWYGSGIITEEITEEINIWDEERQVIIQTWDIYSGYTAKGLEKLTHDELPWLEARQWIPENFWSNKEISLETMQSYYSSN